MLMADLARRFSLPNTIKWIAIYLSLLITSTVSALPVGIEVSLTPVETVISHTGNIRMMVTYKNTSNNSIKFLKRGTALEGRVVEDLFDISNNHGRIRYEGPTLKRLPVAASEFVTILPSQQQSATVTLDGVYHFEELGDYRIQYRDSTNRKRVSSNAVTIKVLTSRARAKQTPSFQTCNATEQARSNSALSAAESYANRARSDMRATPLNRRAEAKRYREWFGPYSEQRWNKADDNIARIASTLNNRTITFDCACDGDVDRSNTIAYVYRSRPYFIYLCPVFWQIPGSGTDSKAGTIIHEVSHFSVVANTNDYAYGQSASRNLANTAPDQAVANAESYQYFAENPRNLSMPTGPGTPPPTDPPVDPGDPGDGLPGDLPPPVPPIEEPDYSYLSSIYHILLAEKSAPPAPPSALPEEPYPLVPASFQGKYAIVVESNQGDPVAEGRHYLYTQENSDIYSIRASQSGVDINFEGWGATDGLLDDVHNWTISFNAKPGESLVRGTYSQARSSYDNTHPWTAIRRTTNNCLMGLGSFRIYEYRYEAGVLERLVADLSMHCGGLLPKLKISIDYDIAREEALVDNSAPPVTPPDPSAPALVYSGAVIKIESQGSELIAGGESLEMSSLDNRITTKYVYYPSKLQVISESANDYWSFEFYRGELDADVNNGKPISIGTYLNALGDRASSPAPSIEVTRRGQTCSQYRGEFRVYDAQEVEGNPLGLDKLKISFKQFCGESTEPLRGTIHIDNTLPQAPFAQVAPVQPGTVLTPQQPELTSAGASLIFGSSDDEEKQEIWNSSNSNFEFSALTNRTRLRMVAFGIGGSQTTVTFIKQEDDSDPLYQGSFGPGVYTVPSNANDSEYARLELTGFGYSCAGSQFRIHDIEYTPNNTLLKLDADFVYKCGNDTTEKYGSIRYDSTLPSASYAPPAAVEGPLRPALPELIYAGAVVALSEERDGATFLTKQFSSENADFSISQTGFPTTGFFFDIVDQSGRYFTKFARGRLDIDPYKNDRLTPGYYAFTVGGEFNLPHVSRANCNNFGQRGLRLFDIAYNDNGGITKLIADLESICLTPLKIHRASIHYDSTLPPRPL